MLFQLEGCAVPQSNQILISTEATIEVTNDGISVTTITILPKVEHLSELIEQIGEPFGDQEIVSNYLLEGIHIRRIQSRDIPEITELLGVVIDERFVWHGQIIQWRDIKQRKIPTNGMVITTEGIPYFVNSGYLSLLSRSWLVEREDGLFVYLQILPTWHIPKNRSPIVGQFSMPLQSEKFTNLGLEILLRDKEAILFMVELTTNESMTGPHDDGPPAVRLGEALMGAPVSEDSVILLIMQANLQTQE